MNDTDLNDTDLNDTDLNDINLQNALKSLPREQARVGFTGRVLRRIEQPSSRRAASHWPAPRWAAAAAAAILVLTLGFGWREWRHHQTVADLRVLLAEKQALEAELEDLRRLTADARPVVYLGSDDDVDLVLDLARFSRRGGFGSGPPAAGMPAADPWTTTERRLARSRPADPRERPTTRVLRAVY
jgi:hypothetical protein